MLQPDTIFLFDSCRAVLSLWMLFHYWQKHRTGLGPEPGVKLHIWYVLLCTKRQIQHQKSGVFVTLSRIYRSFPAKHKQKYVDSAWTNNMQFMFEEEKKLFELQLLSIPPGPYLTKFDCFESHTCAAYFVLRNAFKAVWLDFAAKSVPRWQ